VAVGEFGRVFVSSNAVQWSQSTPGVSFSLNHITFGNGVFLVPTVSGTNLASVDGVAWSPISSGTSRNLYCVDFCDGQFVAVDTMSRVWFSRDGTNWVENGSPNGIRPPKVAGGNGQLLMAANPTLEYFAGNQWKQTSTNIVARGLAFGQHQFVVAAGQRLYQSELVIQLRAVQPGVFDILGPPGAYAIDAAATIGGTNTWQTVTNLVITSSPTRWIDGDSEAPARFYRALLTPDND
jgi:hypothetical protein